MIWRSPEWMAVAWEIVAVQFGYIGLRLGERFGARGLIAVGLLGAINIPYYEEMARRINWWQYHNCRMVSIILGELGIAIALAVLARLLRRGGIATAVIAGVTGGAAIFIAYALGFSLTDRWI